MKTHNFFFVFLICTALVISLSDGYRNCMKPDLGKYTYNQYCTSNTQCRTEYCLGSICSCPPESFYDSISQLCVKRSGYDNRNYDGDCGYIVSPSGLTPGSLYTWNIYGGYTNLYVTVVFLEVDMNPNTCSNNYVEIKEGSTTLLNRRCTPLDSVIFLASRSYSLNINYVAASSQYKGFRAMYFIRSQNNVLTESTGYIASPGYPVGYDNNLNYTWRITAGARQIISLGILVHVENSYDYVKIYDASYATSTPLQSLTGNMSMQNITTTTNNMFIQFKTDGSTSFKGFSARYDMAVPIGYSCSNSDACLPGVSCIANICQCPSGHFYDQTARMCKSRVPHGHTCSSNDWCVYGLTCSNSVCGCPSSQYYHPTNNYCTNKRSFGSSCGIPEECVSGLVCYNSVCRCPTSDYYNDTGSTCKSGVPFGMTCTSQANCVQGLSCISGVCNCSSNQYFDRTSRTCKNRIQYGSSCTSTEQCYSGLGCYTGTCNCSTNQYYDVSYATCRTRYSYGAACTSSSQCSANFFCLSVCGCSTNAYYDTSSGTCTSQFSHASVCTISGQCLQPFICKKETTVNLACLCPNNMYSYNNVCYSDTELQATLSSNTVIKSDSVELHWTTRARIPNVSFNVTWKHYGLYENRTNFMAIKSNYVLVEGLSFSREYNFTITTIVPSDIYYSSKAVRSVLTIVTKRPFGHRCSNSSQCSEHMSCDSGTCQCLSQYYYKTDSCVSRLHKGYECSSNDVCKETLTCIDAECQCPTGHYHDYTQQSCFSAQTEGESCDPSFEDVCQAPELICRPIFSNGTNYTCVRHDYQETYSSINVSTTTESVLIAATVVGWVAAVAACIIIYILCRRHKQKTNTMKKEVDIQRADTTNRKSNHYKKFPTAQDQSSSLYINSSEVTTSVLNGPSVNVIKPTSSTETASQSAKPKTIPKPASSAKPNSSAFQNRGYEIDPTEIDLKEESVYEEIGQVKNTVYGNVEECYANVKSLQKDQDSNSDI